MDELALFGGTPVRSAPYPRWPDWTEAERRGLIDVLESGRWWSSQGTKVKDFEAAWAAFCRVATAVAVTNGTHAIEVALLGLGIGAGDEVIVTDYTFLASASAVATVNAIPVLVDVDPETFCIDPEAVEAAVTPRTRAVVAVHLAGHPADMDRLAEICARHDLVLIEDCAHAHGSEWKGVRVGGLGDAGTFSFQQSKLMTAGEGGAVTVRNPEAGDRVRSFSDCGRRKGQWFYSHYLLGGNYRMTEWQGAVLLAQLGRFSDWNERRNKNGLLLNEALAQIPGVHPQRRDPRTTSQGYYCYVVRIDEAEFGAPRDLIREALLAEGMMLTMSYPAVHLLDVFAQGALAPRHRDLSGWPEYGSLDLPVTRNLADTSLWFNHQTLMAEGPDDLVEAVAKVQAGAARLRARA
jgi:dTDP-4-amino-4,6-dideoxygalactose transaminase